MIATIFNAPIGKILVQPVDEADGLKPHSLMPFIDPDYTKQDFGV